MHAFCQAHRDDWMIRSPRRSPRRTDMQEKLVRQWYAPSRAVPSLVWSCSAGGREADAKDGGAVDGGRGKAPLPQRAKFSDASVHSHYQHTLDPCTGTIRDIATMFVFSTRYSTPPLDLSIVAWETVWYHAPDFLFLAWNAVHGNRAVGLAHSIGVISYPLTPASLISRISSYKSRRLNSACM